MDVKSSDNPLRGDGRDVYDTSSLSELFDNAFALFNDINKSNEPTNSSGVQCNVKKAMRMLEDATRLVSLVDMFSNNESFEEVATENIKYFLLPILLGVLTTKICDVNDRMNLVNVSEIYFIDFLKRVKDYGLTDIDIPETKSKSEETNTVACIQSNAELITEMVSKRHTKVQRYKEKKELENKVDVLQKNLDNININEETKREYFVTLIKLYVNEALDELSSIAAERPILEHMKKAGLSNSTSENSTKPHHVQRKKLEPIIITRDELQKTVYGAGYPSLPVLTVQEFYEQKIKEGIWMDPSQLNQMNGKSLQDLGNDTNKNTQDLEDIEKEDKIEQDDSESLAQARAMDEYKDTHKRGWGNRANRS